MQCSCRIVYVLAALSLLFVLQPAIAGPISGGVRIEIIGTTVAPGNPADPGQIAFTPVTGGGPIATVTFTPYFSGPGVSGYDDPNWQSGSSNYVTAQSRFTVAVRITDEVLGQSGVAAVAGLAEAGWFHRWDGAWRPDFAWLGQADGPGDLTLGANRYWLQIEGDNTSFGDPISANVTVEVTARTA